MALRSFIASIALFALVGCASTPKTWTPQIDTGRGFNQARYERDFAECKAYAQANPDADASKLSKKSALTSGLFGAGIVGAATIATGGLALLPMAAGMMATTGGIAATTGAMGGKAQADAKYRSVIANCLAGRGYHVLD